MVMVQHPSMKNIENAAHACTEKYSRFVVWMAIHMDSGSTHLLIMQASGKRKPAPTPKRVPGYLHKRVTTISKNNSCGIEPVGKLAGRIRKKAEGSIDYLNTRSGQLHLDMVAAREAEGSSIWSSVLR